MSDPNDDLDEVALNVLLAEGLDVPTAVEASRRDGDAGAGVSGWVGMVILLAAAFVAIVVYFVI
jgi:hypothetical protein